MAAADPRPVVVCLCAAWCGVCRAWQPEFERVAARHPHARYRWIDVEDEAEMVGEIEVEDFPVIGVLRAGEVLFAGTLRPDASQLERVVAASLAAPAAPPATAADPAWRALARTLHSATSDPG
jgi:thioredoxin 1